MHALLRPSLLALLGAFVFAGPASAQTPSFDVEATYLYPPVTGTATTHTAFQVNNDGAFIARGFVRDVGNTAGCAPFLPATGSGTRFMWLPCRGSVRFGRVPTAQTNWDDANMDDFTFAAGNQVVASGYGAFAYGDQVTASSTVGVAFGSGVTTSGTAGFSSGASNICSGFACTAMGYTTYATGQGSVALGYRTYAFGDYTVALGYRAQTCSTAITTPGVCSGTIYTGGFVYGDEGSFHHVVPTDHNQFVVRAEGGVRFYTNGSDGSAGTPYTPSAGVFLTAGGSSWNVVSDRNRKDELAAIDGEDLLARLAQMPVTSWRYLAEEDRAVRHVGPMAQDWQRLVDEPLGLNSDDLSINTSDFDGVNLVAIQALEARTRQLQEAQAALAAQAEEVEALRAAQAEMEARLARLEALLAPTAAAAADDAQ